jgi:hypothetical protein
MLICKTAERWIILITCTVEEVDGRSGEDTDVVNESNHDQTAPPPLPMW